MAVENKYIDSDRASGYLSDAVSSGGGKVIKIVKTFEIAAADDDGSVYRIAQIGSSDVLLSATVMCDAITGGTDFEMGLYNTNTGSVVSKGLFMTGQTLATASKVLDGIAAVDIANRDKEIYEMLSLTTDPKKVYDIALTGDTVGTAAGTVTVVLEILSKA